MVRAKLEEENFSLSHDYPLYQIAPDIHQTYSGKVRGVGVFK